MARNGSGTYSLPALNPVVTATTISSTWANNTMSDIATALTQSIASDGQTVPTANLPMGSFKLTGLTAGSGAGDSVRYEQVLLLAGGTMTGAIVYAAAQGSVTVQKFIASGTYTRPAGLRAALIYIKAGGASGGSSTLGQGRGGGGGEGEEAWKLVTAAVLGASQTVTIGAGSVSVAANQNVGGSTGGTTSFGALVTAAGGLGAASGNNGGAGGTGGSGGSGGDWSFAGAAGQYGTDVTATVFGGHAAGGGKGAGGDGAAALPNSGGGGGSGYSGGASGAGGSGVCIVIEFY